MKKHAIFAAIPLLRKTLTLLSGSSRAESAAFEEPDSSQLPIYVFLLLVHEETREILAVYPIQTLVAATRQEI